VIFRKEIIRLVPKLTVPLKKKILSEVLTAKSCKNAPIMFVISVRPYVSFVLVLFVDAYSVTFDQKLANIFYLVSSQNSSTD